MVELLEEVTTEEESGTDIVFVKDVPETFLETLMSIDITTAKKIYLVDNNDNHVNYYIKLAEEILFNYRMRHYIMDQTINISLYKKSYDINHNEVLLSEISISDYYDKLNYTPVVRQHKNDYYDMGIVYSNQHVETDNAITNDFVELLCEHPTTIKINSTNYIKRGVVSAISNKISHQSFACVYSIIDIMLTTMYSFEPKKYKHERKTFGEIRSDLALLYTQYSQIPNYISAIYDILISEGKQQFIKYLIAADELTLSNLVNMPTYTLSLMDYWILCVSYNIPAFIIRDKIPINKKTEGIARIMWLGLPPEAVNNMTSYSIPKQFFCIMVSNSSSNTPIYTLIVKDSTLNGRLFTMNDFVTSIQSILQESFINGPTIDQYIQRYIPKMISIEK